MQAHENRLRQLLDSTQQYIVPLFQRFYVWNKPTWQHLWDDLTELLDEADPQNTHFLGSVVEIPVAAAPSDLTPFIIIDGQQRLATLLMLLTVHNRHTAWRYPPYFLHLTFDPRLYSAISKIGQWVDVCQRRSLIEDVTLPFNASITLKHTIEVVVADCNRNGLGLQSARIQDRIICNYRYRRDHIICH